MGDAPAANADSEYIKLKVVGQVSLLIEFSLFFALFSP